MIYDVADPALHGRYFKVYDANGLEWGRVVRCDTITGEIEQVKLLQECAAYIDEESGRIATDQFRVAAPLLVVEWFCGQVASSGRARTTRSNRMARGPIPEVEICEVADLADEHGYRDYEIRKHLEQIDVQMGALAIHKDAGKRGINVTLNGEKVQGLFRLEMALDSDGLPEVVLHIRPTAVPKREK